MTTLLIIILAFAVLLPGFAKAFGRSVFRSLIIIAVGAVILTLLEKFFHLSNIGLVWAAIGICLIAFITGYL